METEEKKMNEEMQPVEELPEASAQTEEQPQEEQPQENTRGNTMMYSVRLIAAFYLVYVSYGIFKNFFDGNENITPTLLILAVIFVIFAVCFGLSGYKGLQRGQKEKKEKGDKQQGSSIFMKPAPQQKKSISERARMVEQTEDEEEE